MLPQAALIALASAAAFGALTLMSDRKRGAFLAQVGLALAASLVFVAIIADGPVLGVEPEGLAAFAVGLISAAAAGMLYHLYLGRFERVWTARGVFSAVYLALSAMFGLVFASLI
ncbi:MAG: hypothetical protein ACE37J_21050 [Pikeienuella sp.]|uniref:hypothetical protein n=1 Tax=Pikeienuella sp. TaxID=2831957 RepID=UPI0039191A59